MNYYSIFCDTEETTVYGSSVFAPNFCYNNPTDIVDTSTIVQLPNPVVQNVVSVTEEPLQKTAGIYKCDTITISAAANSSTTFSITYPMLIYIVRVYPDIIPANQGDSFSILYPYNSTIGVLSADLPASTTTIPLASSVLYSLRNGYYLSTVVSGTTVNLGRIIFLSLAGAVIETPSTSIIPAGSTILLSVKLVDDFIFASTNNIMALSQGRTHGAYLPAGVDGVVVYNNNSSSTGSLTIHFEYMY